MIHAHVARPRLGQKSLCVVFEFGFLFLNKVIITNLLGRPVGFMHVKLYSIPPEIQWMREIYIVC
jgi:hypothetical protein